MFGQAQEAEYIRGNGRKSRGTIRLDHRGGQVHAHLTRDDGATVQVGAFTQAEWHDPSHRRRTLRGFGVTRYPAIQRRNKKF